MSVEHQTSDLQLEMLLLAFWNEMQDFHISPTFDAKGSYSERMGWKLDDIKSKYRNAIQHELLKRTLGT